MWMEILSVIKHTLMISFFVFVMMLIVDFVNISTRGSVSALMKGGKWRQYTVASFLGSTPGCLGAFMNVTLYVHGIISFGAIVGGMIATSGDEAFVMLAQFPGTAAVLMALLFFSGIVFAWVSDKIIAILGITPSRICHESEGREGCPQVDISKDKFRIINADILYGNIRSLSFTRFLLLAVIGSFLVLIASGIIGTESWDWKRVTFIILALCSLYISISASEHYLHSHIWDHIIKKHLFRVFLWTFGALFFIHWGLSFLSIESFIRNNMICVLILSALIGIIPESGPHMVLVMMYAQGIIPFSVLFTSSFVQDGHGMLPMLSYSIRDSLLIKSLNLAFGLASGLVLYGLGL